MKEQWIVTHIKDDENKFNEMINLFKKEQPKTIGTDTETTGLHLVKDKPFLVVFGWFLKDGVKRVYTFNCLPTFLKQYEEIVNSSFIKFHWFWNAKFDIAMLENVNVNLYNLNNICEGMLIPKLLFDYVDSPAKMALKTFTAEHLYKDATVLRDEIQRQLLLLTTERNTLINLQLKEKYKKEFPDVSISKLKSVDGDFDQYEKYSKECFDYWKELEEKTKEPNYSDIEEDVLLEYAADDIIYTLEAALKYVPTILSPESKLYQAEVFWRESNLTKVLAKIEKNGLTLDLKYLSEVQEKVKDKINEWYAELYELLETNISVQQHKELLTWFNNKGINLVPEAGGKQNTNDETLRLYLRKFKEYQEVAKDKTKGEKLIRVIQLIQKLRRFTKWYSTYITGYIKKADGDKMFGYFFSLGTKTGRFTSGWQQFPRSPMTTCWCVEENDDDDSVYCENKDHWIYHPRKISISRYQNGYLGFCDYSQMELRVAAAQTLKLNKPDSNLLNMFINFNHKKDWVETDMHGLTTEKVWHLTPEDSSFKAHRSIAKQANFTILFGGREWMINQRIYNGNNLPEATRFLKVFEETFPGFSTIRDYCKHNYNEYKQIRNDWKRLYRWLGIKKRNKYTGKEETSIEVVKRNTKNASSCIIQGGCADFFKEKLIEVDNYIMKNKLKIKIINLVHDEIQFDCPEEEINHLFTIKNIMEEQNVWGIPMVCELDLSNTNWYDKKGSDKFEFSTNN